VHHRLGLDIAELVHPIVHELEGLNAPVEGLLHAVHPPLEEVAALHGEHAAHGRRSGRAEVFRA
jgi:hypothetical protein